MNLILLKNTANNDDSVQELIHIIKNDCNTFNEDGEQELKEILKSKLNKWVLYIKYSDTENFNLLFYDFTIDSEQKLIDELVILYPKAYKEYMKVSPNNINRAFEFTKNYNHYYDLIIERREKEPFRDDAKKIIKDYVEFMQEQKFTYSLIIIDDYKLEVHINKILETKDDVTYKIDIFDISNFIYFLKSYYITLKRKNIYSKTYFYEICKENEEKILNKLLDFNCISPRITNKSVFYIKKVKDILATKLKDNTTNKFYILMNNDDGTNIYIIKDSELEMLRYSIVCFNYEKITINDSYYYTLYEAVCKELGKIESTNTKLYCDFRKSEFYKLMKEKFNNITVTEVK